MILDAGDKVLIVHRRLFEQDRIRLFIGNVQAYDNGIVKVSGHTWMEDFKTQKCFEKEGLRTKIFSISSGTLIVYQIPEEVHLPQLAFEKDTDGKLWLTDGLRFKIDLTEREQPRYA